MSISDFKLYRVRVFVFNDKVIVFYYKSCYLVV